MRILYLGIITGPMTAGSHPLQRVDVNIWRSTDIKPLRVPVSRIYALERWEREAVLKWTEQWLAALAGGAQETAERFSSDQYQT